MPAPLLKRIDAADMSPNLRDAYQRSLDLRGDATFFEVFANHPDLYHWYSEAFYGDVFCAGTVDIKLKEVLRLRLSTHHGCRFCNQGNREDARANGITDVEIEAIVEGDLAVLSESYRSVVRLADELALTNQNGHLSEALYAELGQHLSDAEILELGLVGGILSGVAKFLFAFDLVEREDSCPFPVR